MIFVFKTRNFVSTTMDFVFKMRNFVCKMMDFAGGLVLCRVVVGARGCLWRVFRTLMDFLEMTNFLLEMMDFLLEMMNFLLKRTCVLLAMACMPLWNVVNSRTDNWMLVSFQWKNPDFLLRNPDFILKNVDFMIIKQESVTVLLFMLLYVSRNEEF